MHAGLGSALRVRPFSSSGHRDFLIRAVQRTFSRQVNRPGCKGPVVPSISFGVISDNSS
jgi:hypothetical protein